MPRFGKRSRLELASAHPDLQRLFNEVIKDMDCAVICGHRGKAAQDKAAAEGNSKLRWPASKHNKTPALAVDVIPWPADWNNIERFKMLAGIVKWNAKQLGIKIAWGGDWRTFKDYPHYELT